MSETKPKRMALIASKGTLDWAYPPFILASTAVAMEMEVAVFFTFYGLTLLNKKIEAKVAPATIYADENALWPGRISKYQLANSKCHHGECARI